MRVHAPIALRDEDLTKKNWQDAVEPVAGWLAEQFPDKKIILLESRSANCAIDVSRLSTELKRREVDFVEILDDGSEKLIELSDQVVVVNAVIRADSEQKLLADFSGVLVGLQVAGTDSVISRKNDYTLFLGFISYDVQFFANRERWGELVVINGDESVLSLVKPVLDQPIPYVPHSKDIHKYQRGAVVIFGGDRPYQGALQMAAEAARISGAGWVMAFSHKMINASNTKGVIYASLEEPHARFSFQKASVYVWGVGMLPSSPVRHYAKELTGIHIIDAGAISHVAYFKGQCLLTPHEAELARLMGCSVDEVRADRVRAALEASERFAMSVFLKGAMPVFVHDGQVYVIDFGSELLAVAGSGDVFSGLVGSFCAQGLSLFEGVMRAVHVQMYVVKAGRLPVLEDYESYFLC